MAVQSNYRYTLEVSGDTVFEVVSFRLTEHLSELFRLEIEAVSFEDSPVFSDILDKSATLTFSQDDIPVRYVNGIVTEFIQGETGAHRTRYKILIEPSLSRTNLQSDCRIFQHKDSEEIIRTVLGKSGVSRVNFHLVKPYWQREYCVQYRETDLGFIQRLAAEEGSYYYFEHNADTHTLNFTNHSATSKSLGELLYEANPAGDRPEPALWRWDYREQLRTVTQTLRDYTFTNPRYNQEHHTAQTQPNVDGANPSRNYEKYDYPGRYKRDEQGSPFTQYRQEYERRESEVVYAVGDDQRVIPGYRFTLKGHRRKDFNQGWLVVGVVHTGRQTGILEEESGDEGNFYENEIKLIPQKSQWRPTPQARPVVDGPQIAHIVGPANEEIYCDEWGRVKVQFPWDRVGEENEHSSCWVRVSQAWAGAQYGNMAIPRIGHEVIVDFLEGDPDQPIITGRTYHSTTEPPYGLPANKTRMTIKSKTHKGDGFNELRFEDEKGVEEVFIHAEKDQNNVVKHNETTKVGNDRTENIGHDEEIHIVNDRTETVGHNEKITIGNDRVEDVVRDESLTIGRNQKNLINRNRITKIVKDERINIGNHRKLDVYADQLITSGGNYSHEVSGKTEWQSGELFKQLCKEYDAVGYDEICFASQGGTVIISASGITFKGKVTIKGSLAIVGGTPELVKRFSAVINKGLPLVKPCNLR
ncbi:type VI secretion system tip protein TssI/VgrG [Pasteurella atlantica]|uniref:Type VI secretion system tip protein TssI/VgrG n=2 Tax=Pasteurellaceae TaxID=712 RepID=A0ACC6HPL1_9PAST|nr:type VI secretion system tip protein TssI/VgrG [Pasteurella atlantica]MDP8052812.1 type VI secretion system tip protein TssI/VgrG [Pasteurella atlantica]MDP8149497.1 type VI secretion system tip protein TssI/VgrG [Pasteurella atlantica]